MATNTSPQLRTGVLRRPGGNITGLSMLLTELAAKELEIMKEALPHLKRVGVLLTSWVPSHHLVSHAVATAAQKIGIEVVTVQVGTASDLDAAFVLMARERVNGFLAVASPLTRSERSRLAELALKYQLAGMYGTTDNAEAGGLMSYAPNHVDLTRRAATYIDKILKGAKPAELPVEQPTRFELMLHENCQSARHHIRTHNIDPGGAAD